MLDHKRILLLVILLLIPAGLLSADDIPDRFELDGVELNGVESVFRKELAETLAARLPPVWKFWLPGPELVREDIEDDVARIRQFYRKEGYYRTAVAVSVEVAALPADTEEGAGRDAETPEKNSAVSAAIPRVRVTYTVTEGMPVRVSSVGLDIQPPVDQAAYEAALRGLTLHVGDIFRIADYEAAKDSISLVLGVRGYPFSEVAGQAVVDPKVDEARITFSANPGSLSEFGPISIVQEGEAVSEKVIRRALTFKSGEPYDIEKVETSRRNLIGLDIFRTVVIQVEKPNVSGESSVPVQVKLKTKESRSVEFGIGYGTEDLLRLRAALTYRNLYSQGGRLTLSGRGSALQRKLQLSYTQPYFWDANNILTLSGGNELEEPPAYKNRRIFGNVNLNRKLRNHLFLRLGYQLSFNKEQSSAAEPPLGIDIEKFVNESTAISAVDLEIGRDTRDNLLSPTSGTYLGALISVAPQFIGSELAYYQPAITAKAYHKIFKEVVLASQVKAATIQGIQGTDFIPAYKRLYLGGSSTVRGYDLQKLPPLDSNAQPIGGQTGFNAAVEVRFPLYQALSGVVFLDAGLLDIEPFRLDFSETRYTCGVGLRYDTVVGPIRVDWGYKLNPQTGSDIGNTTTPDKVVDDRWRIYFNIGQAF